MSEEEAKPRSISALRAMLWFATFVVTKPLIMTGIFLRALLRIFVWRQLTGIERAQTLSAWLVMAPVVFLVLAVLLREPLQDVGMSIEKELDIWVSETASPE